MPAEPQRVCSLFPVLFICDLASSGHFSAFGGMPTEGWAFCSRRGAGICGGAFNEERRRLCSPLSRKTW